MKTQVTSKEFVKQDCFLGWFKGNVEFLNQKGTPVIWMII